MESKPPSPSRASEPGAAGSLSHFPAVCATSHFSSESNRGRINTSGENVMELRVHLKICEGCGCLWYRDHIETRVYCAACNERFKEFPTPQSRKRRGRPRKLTLPTVFAVQASVEMIFEERSAGANNTSYVERPAFPGLQLAHSSTHANPVSPIRRTPLTLETGVLSTRAALACVTTAGGAQ